MNYNKGWIGFNDIATTNTWVWTDGTPSDYTNWNTNEPNGGHIENCAELLTSGLWNDIGCTYTFFWFVCNHPS